jgi:periplasmic divalent cation tolerance protein
MVCVVLVTVPSGRFVQKITKALLKNHLVACVSVTTPVSSQYWWQGKIESSKETLLIIKTRRSLIKKVCQEIKRHHPYDVPEIIALPVVAGDVPYLKWIKKETSR